MKGEASLPPTSGGTAATAPAAAAPFWGGWSAAGAALGVASTAGVIWLAQRRRQQLEHGGQQRKGEEVEVVKLQEIHTFGEVRGQHHQSWIYHCTPSLSAAPLWRLTMMEIIT